MWKTYEGTSSSALQLVYLTFPTAFCPPSSRQGGRCRNIIAAYKIWNLGSVVTCLPKGQTHPSMQPWRLLFDDESSLTGQLREMGVNVGTTPPILWPREGDHGCSEGGESIAKGFRVVESCRCVANKAGINASPILISSSSRC
jgi:hypothetical protein